jgi:hypothetical protein
VRRSGIVLTIAFAWVGVVVGHLVAYLLTYPSQAVRHVHLTLTGHSWTGLATGSLLAAVPVILLAVTIRALRSSPAPHGPALAIRLAAIQIPAFALIEVLERGSVTEAATDPAVFVGLVVQVVLAVLAAWLLGVLTKAVLAVAGRVRGPRRRASSPSTPTLDEVPPRLDRLLPSRRRAPPRISVP